MGCGEDGRREASSGRKTNDEVSPFLLYLSVLRLPRTRPHAWRSSESTRHSARRNLGLMSGEKTSIVLPEAPPSLLAGTLRKATPSLALRAWLWPAAKEVT